MSTPRPQYMIIVCTYYGTMACYERENLPLIIFDISSSIMPISKKETPETRTKGLRGKNLLKAC